MKRIVQKLRAQGGKRLALAVFLVVLVAVAVAPVLPEQVEALTGIPAIDTLNLAGSFAKLFGVNVDPMQWMLSKMVNIVLSLVSWLVWIAGSIFNYSIDTTLNMNGLLANIPVVDIGWRIIRDIANIVFIFIALWSGISITLGLHAEKAWGLLAHMVLVALFINFSLFITKTIVDGTNIAALHFYNLMKDPASTTDADAGISGAFMKGLKLQTLYDSKTLGRNERTDIGRSVLNEGVSQKQAQVSEWNIVLVGVFGSIFLVITAFVFFAAAFLFIIRAITLIMLMILSPLAFVAWILPGASGLASKWWSTLWSQAFFAPLYMALAYVVVATINSPGFGNYTKGSTFAAAFTSTSGGTHISLIFNFLILIGLMIGCLIVAQSLGGKGAELGMKWAKTISGAATGAVGRFAVRGTYLSAAGGVAKGAGWIAQKTGFKGLGDKLYSGGQVLDKAQRKIDVAELDKRFGRSWIGNTAIGKFVRDQTTSRLVHAKFGGGKTVHEAYEEDERMRERRDQIGKIEQAETAQGRLEVAQHANEKYRKPEVAEFTDANGNIDSVKYEAVMRNYMASFTPERANYATDAEFADAQTLHTNVTADIPDRTNYAAGHVGDKAYIAVLQQYTKAFFEQPGATFTDHTGVSTSLTGHDQTVAQTSANNRATKSKASENNFTQAEGDMYSAVNRIAPTHFADMTEHQIEALIKYANFDQIKALMGAKHWTQEEKEHMVQIRWNEEVKGWESFQKSVDEFERSSKVFGDLARSGAFTIKGDGTAKNTDGEGYVLDNAGNRVIHDGSPIKNPEAPKLSKRLEHWLRNKTTPAEFVLMAAIRPEIFKIESLVRTMRWGQTHKELRNNENINYNLRNELSMTKDSNLNALKEENRDHPYYLPESTPTQRGAALAAAWTEALNAARTAKAAATTAGRAATADAEARMEFDKAFNAKYAEMTPADTLRMRRLLDWKSGRASDEIGNARSAYRKSREVAMVISPKIFQTIAGRDIEDVRLIVQHMLSAYKSEIDGEGVMTDEARKTLKWLITDPRAKQIPVPDDFRDGSGNVMTDLQNLFRDLQRQGELQGKNLRLGYEAERERQLRSAGINP